jgi:hypothetical protein
MPDPRRELDEQEPDEWEQEPEEFGEEELSLDSDAWEEEDLEGLDEEQSDLDARAEGVA